MSIMVGVPLLFLILACYIAASSTCVVLVVDAWILSSSSSPMTHPVSSMKTTTATGYYQQQHNTYSSFSFSSSRLNSAVEDSVDVDNEVDNVSLPDFGKTTVEVDTIKLVKKRRKKKVEEEKTDDSLYDTTDGVPAKDNNNSVSEKWRRTDLMGTSLIDQTLEELSKDIDFQTTQKRIKKVGLVGISKEERIQRRRALDKLNVKPFNEFIEQEMAKTTTTTTSTTTTTVTATAAVDASAITSSSLPFQLTRKQSKVLQINIGLYCNQACGHCHVESSPLRKTEMMTTATTARCLQLLKNSPSITTLDITGGAPELNDNFRYLVSTARAIRPDLIIIDRCNLTVLQEPGQHDLVDFLKDHDVTIIASLPCYSEDNVDTQRGNGVFERSISALLALNEAGYGKQTEHTTTTTTTTGSENKSKKSLVLDLVYNPLGAFLPPPQEDLQIQYKKQLQDNFGILFNSLYTITNMPIKRFADFLHRRDELNEYMMLLVRNFNSNTLTNLMCLDTINIGWNGKIYDCDFNQQLGYEIGADKIHSNDGDCKTVFDIESLDELLDTKIRNDNHCFGCTAGMGSS